MTTAAATRRNAILEQALSLERPQLAQFLDRACADDTKLRDEVERLLRLHGQMGTWSIAAFSGSPGPTLDPGRWLGRYELQGVLGSGGMGIVYRAHDPVINRPVAIKVLAPRSDRRQHSSSRFLSELRMLGSIAHDNVVRVYDYGDVDDLRYIVMELLEGEDLGRAIASGHCADPVRKLSVMRQIAAALVHIHAAGIVHCDLKPGNVFLEACGRAKLMDFGIAQSRDSVGAACREIVGTPQYMAPEQLRGLAGSHLMDVYAFGVVLFEVLTGQRPFSGHSSGELLANIAAHPIPTAPLVRAGVADELIALIRRATDKDPAARPQSFSEIVQVMDRMDARACGRRSVPPRRSTGRWLLAAASCSSITLVSLSGVRPDAKAAPASAEVTRPAPAGRPAQVGGSSTPFAPAVVLPPAETARMLTKADPERKKPVQGVARRAAPLVVNGTVRGSGVVINSSPILRTPEEAMATSPRSAALDGESLREDPGVGAVEGRPILPGASAADSARDTAGSLEWERLQNSEDAAVLRAFEGKYPQSPYRDRAAQMAGELDARDEARREVLALLERYAAANRARNIREIAAVWPGLSVERLRTIEASFAHAEKLDFTLQPAREPELGEPAARSAFAVPSYRADAAVVCLRRVQMIDRSGVRPDPSESRVVVRLSRVDNKWAIVSID